MMVWVFFLRFIVPVLGVFYGTSLIADEVDDKTITYLFTRPIRRGSVLVGKYLAYLVCTTLVVLPRYTLVYFLLVPFGEVPASFRWLLADLGLLALGLAVYGALFALVGTVLKRPLVVGLVFAFGWEQVALVMPGYLRRFTLAHYLQVWSRTPCRRTGWCRCCRRCSRNRRPRLGLPPGAAAAPPRSAWPWPPGRSSAGSTCSSSRGT